MAEPSGRISWVLTLVAVFAIASCVAEERTASCPTADVTAVKSEGRTEWTVDDDVLLKHDLKDVVDCAEEGDVVSLNVSKAIIPASRVTLTKSITIRGAGGQPSGLSCPEGQGLSCPEGQGLFLIRDCSISLTGLRIENCHIVQHLAPIEAKSGPKGKCGKEANRINLTNVEMRDINSDRSDGTAFVSFDRSDCWTIHANDVSLVRLQGAPFLSPRGTFRNLKLINNEARAGNQRWSALFVVKSPATFVNLFASGTPGAVMTVVNTTITIQNSSFVNNSNALSADVLDTKLRTERRIENSVANAAWEKCCIFSHQGRVTIENSHFSGNKGYRGGCIYLFSPDHLLISSSTFSNNKAWWGGCIWLQEGDTKVPATIHNCTFRKNSAIEGGALHLLGGGLSSRVTITDSSFLENNATERGGAIRVTLKERKRLVLNVTNGIFSKNLGYAIDATQGSQSREAVLVSKNLIYMPDMRSILQEFRLVIDKTTFKGCPSGCAGIRSKTAFFSRLTVSHCSFVDHAADRGAAVNAEGCNFVHIVNSIMASNKGTNGGAIWAKNVRNFNMSTSTLLKNNASRGGAVFIDGCKATMSDCRFEGNTAAMEGGAIRFTGQKELKDQRSVFVENRAKIGAGLCFMWANRANMISSNVSKNKASVYGGGIAIFLKKKRKQPILTFRGIVFKGNEAILGGGIYVARNDVEGEAVRMVEPLIEDNFAHRGGAGIFTDARSTVKLTCKAPESPKSKDHVCASMSNNTLAPGAYGQHFATGSADFRVHFKLKGRPRVNISTDESYLLQKWKSGDEFPPVCVVLLDFFGNGPPVTKLHAVERKHREEFEVSGYQEYIVGEMLSSKDHGFIRNDLRVNAADEDSTLDAGKQYRPPGNYSLTVQVKDVTKKTLTINVEVRDCLINEMKELDGAYCQTCDFEHYNFDPNGGNCTFCPQNANCSSEWIIPIEGYWNAGPTSPSVDRCLLKKACKFNSTGKMTSSADVAQIRNGEVKAYYTEALCIEGHEGVLCGACSNGWGQSVTFACGKCRTMWLAALSAVSVVVNLWLLSVLEIISTMRTSILTYKQLGRSSAIMARSDSTQRSIGRLVDGTADENSEEIEKEEVRFQEFIKITVNTLQRVSVGSKLGVTWSASLIKLYRSWDFIGAATTKLGTYGWDCLLPYNGEPSRSVLREVLVFVMPLLVLAVISAYWLVRKSRGRTQRRTAWRLCFLTAAIIFNASYFSIVESSLNAFYCVHVHDSIDNPSHTTEYWAIDTSVVCKSKDHWLVLGVVGIPGIIFSVFFPIFVIVFLVYLRHSGQLYSDWAQETMGIFLGGYKDEYVYWDAVILLSKALMSAILAFSYNLGGNLQGLLAIGVLVFFLFVQTSLRPFKEELGQLNGMESLSLLITIFTLLAGVILDDERMKPKGMRMFLIVAVIAANIGMLLYLVFLIVTTKLRSIKYNLEAEEVHCGSGNAFDVGKAWVHHSLKSVRNWRRARHVDNIDDDPIGSSLIPDDERVICSVDDKN